MSKKSEKKLQSQILKAIRLIPLCWAMPHIATAYTGCGHPDIYGFIYGYFFAIEVKLPGEEPTRIQQFVMREIEKNGGRTIVATSVADAVSFVTDIAKMARS